MALRVTGGILGGRIIRVPKTAVRPTQDRVRAAVFSSLAERIPGARVLDLFAGSGAIGLEAYSRGAASVCWVESDRRVLVVLNDNIRQLCGPGAAAGLKPETRVVAADVLKFVQQRRESESFDLIFADPPYDHDGGWLKKILFALGMGSMLNAKGLLVMEVSARVPESVLAHWPWVKTKIYGETRICMLPRIV